MNSLAHPLGINKACATSLTFQPMPYEVDFTGFLSNTVIPIWLERLRLQLMTEQFGNVDLCSPDNLSVIARTQIDYIKPIIFTDRIEGLACVVKVMNTSWKINFSFIQKITNKEHIRAEQLGVFIDHVTQKPKRAPLEIRHYFDALKISDQPLKVKNHE